MRYAADRLSITSGEVVGNDAIPDRSRVGEYWISGLMVNWDRIPSADFQDLWREASGEDRYSFSQQFTNYLISSGYIPANTIGSMWASVSGQRLGISGRCYALTVTGEPYVVFRKDYPYP